MVGVILGPMNLSWDWDPKDYHTKLVRIMKRSIMSVSCCLDKRALPFLAIWVDMAALAYATGTPINVCKTCWSFHEDCQPVESYPNVTISEYGAVRGEQKMMSEIYARGPIACGIGR